MNLHLKDYQFQDANTILRWPADADEMAAWAGVNTPFPGSAELFACWHAKPGVHPAVLCDDKQLIGYGEIWVDEQEREIELARIIIAPAERDKGWGQLLVRLLLERAADFEFANVFMRVVAGNDRAISCYQRAGFVRVAAAIERQFNHHQPRPYVWLTQDLRDRGGTV